MKKVLVVDDSKTIRTLCEWIYKGLEDRILTADSAAAARDIIARESPDVVIVDYTLPDADSYEFVSSIHTASHVIMLGGTYAPFDENKARACGALDVMMKPFKANTFFETVDRAAAMSLAAAAPAAMPEPAADPVMQTTTSGVHGPIHAASGVFSANFGQIRSHAGIQPAAAHNVAPISSVTNTAVSSSGSHSSVSRRFNFPGASSPAIPVAQPELVTKQESATPKTPVPSISPAFVAQQAEAAAHHQSFVGAQPQQGQQVQIDPAIIRAEVIMAVKAMLPAIVSSYLKKLIQAEVKPQLQSWVDTRVEALIKKLFQQHQ